MKFETNIDTRKINDFHYSPNPSFGSVIVPITLSCELGLEDTKPEVVNINSETNFSLSGFTSALHYGQSIFEGMKAFKLADNKIGVYRLGAHASRFKNSAKIMRMSQVSADVFSECILRYLDHCRQFVPNEEGHSLYIRPLMFGSDAVIKVKPSERYRFLIMSSIVGPYFNSGNDGVNLYCHPMFTRAFVNGTGEAKTSANYALSLPHLSHATALGYDQVLYLDSKTNKNIEELGGMNLFILKGDKIITPELSGTILSGITRDSILKIAKKFNYKPESRTIPIQELIDSQDSISAFASGTAATIVPIQKIGLQDKDSDAITTIKFNNDPIIQEFRKYLLDTQINKTEFSKEWLTIL